jgi:hypothetical protein
MAPSPERARDAFREEYRSTRIPRWYSGHAHLALTSIVSVGGVVACASRVRAPTPMELAAIPVFFLIANFGEYVGHRYPMHNRWPGLGAVFRRHTGTHHRFFTASQMEGRDARDWHVTLFPPVLLVFFFGVMGAPIALVLATVASANTGWLFFATALAYFVVYEWLHLSYHAPAGSIWSRLPGLAALARHHRLHHDPARMSRWNFNISFPIADALLGTTFRPDAPPDQAK